VKNHTLGRLGTEETIDAVRVPRRAAPRHRSVVPVSHSARPEPTDRRLTHDP
jgi:hypothetical protein